MTRRKPAPDPWADFKAATIQAARAASTCPNGPHEPVKVPHICTSRNCSCRKRNQFDLPQTVCVTCRTAWPCESAWAAGGGEIER